MCELRETDTKMWTIVTPPCFSLLSGIRYESAKQNLKITGNVFPKGCSIHMKLYKTENIVISFDLLDTTLRWKGALNQF